MRTKFSILNAGTNFLILFFRTIMTFVVRTIFIKILGEECLGVNSLFTSILSMLSLAELGISTAMSFSLYQALAKKDDEKISILMTYFKKFYYVIGTIILVVGLILVPFIPSIVGETNVSNIILIFILYLFNTVSLYYISYKDILIQADQQNYKLSGINFMSYVFMYLFQIVFLFLTKSFVIYLLVQIGISFIQRILINRFISNRYNNINFSSKKKLQKNEIDPIKDKVKAMFLHKIGNYLVTGTDSIIISKFVGIVSVGIYTNYLSIINMTTTLLNSLYNGVTASFGNLATSERESVQEKVFDHLNFLSFVIYGFVCIIFLILINPFISLWIGNKYILSMPIVALMCINFYMNGLRLPIDTVKEATGTYTQDKYVPLLQAILNLIISITLTIKFGIIGVILGTVISYALLPLWFKPMIVYKYVFKKKVWKYIYEYIKRTLILVGILILIILFVNFINIKMNLIGLVINGLIISICYFGLITLIFRNNDYFIYYMDMIKKFFHNIKNHSK